jgi:uncharacterized membrane protein
MLPRAVSWYEFLLFVHVLGAFAVIGATAWFWAMTFASMRTSRASFVLALGRLVQPATIVVGFGTVVTLVFGIWLAIYVDGYELWDGWILASIVLWVIASETGRRGGKYHQQAIPPLVEAVQAGRDEIPPEWRALPANRTAILFDTISTLAVLLILILMIFKPGA